MCERNGRADSDEQHKRDCIQCGCLVCRSLLVERYSVVEKESEQQSLTEF